MNWKSMKLSGWGRAPVVEVRACRPERQSDIATALREAGGSGLIAHGGGRAYGDAALNANGGVMMTGRLNRILSFDPASGEIVCEPGVTFRELLDVFIARGFMAPTSPGTAFVTVGGAVAADIHGKNHDSDGSFGDHVKWFDLLLADGTTKRVSAESDPDLFAATIGGMGLTGIIRDVCFRMRSGASAAVRVKERRLPDLDSFIAAFREVRDSAPFSVGWIDAMAHNGKLGRGILETAEFEPSAKPRAKTKTRSVPIDFPDFLLHPAVVRGFNEFYFRRIPKAGRERVRSFGDFLYPLDAVHNWNRIYGRWGFHQFQCVIPDAEASPALRKLMGEIARAGQGSFLAVLKTLGGEGRGHLSFPMHGFTLALDFRRRRGITTLLEKLSAITRDHGGRVYLAKDAVLTPEMFRAMYPKVGAFEEVLRRVDPDAHFTSDQARRLGLKPPRPGVGP